MTTTEIRDELTLDDSLAACGGCLHCLEPLTEDEEILHGICNDCADELATEADREATLQAERDSNRRRRHYNPDGPRAYAH